jgi:ankyrin repeat protein
MIRIGRDTTRVGLVFGAALYLCSTARYSHAAEPKPDQAVKPRLDQCTLECGRQVLKPYRIVAPNRLEYHVGGRRFEIEQCRVVARGEDGEEPQWTAKGGDGQHLQWAASDGKVAYLLAYLVGEGNRFDRYVTPPTVLRLDLANGKWLDPLPTGTAKAEGTRSAQVLSVLPDNDYVAVLAALERDRNDQEAGSAGFEVSCFRTGSAKPLWAKSVSALGERSRPGAYLLAAAHPNYAESHLQQLSWMGDRLLVCAEAVQPILCLNRDTGTQLWRLDRPWELERGFIGPSVWQHYIGRFGQERFGEDKAKAEAARPAFDKQFDCAIVGGPVPVPLDIRRDSDSHSVFIAVSKATRGGFSGYTADCILYEFNDRGEPVAMLKLPQMVRGGHFRKVKDGVVWQGQNETFFRVSRTGESSRIGMGPGGSDHLLRMPWLRQVADAERPAWLTSGKAGDPVAYSDTHAFCLPAGGYVADGDRATFHFPLTAIGLRTGHEQPMLLHAPTQGTIAAPKTNFSGTSAAGRTAIRTFGPYLVAVTRLHTDAQILRVTLGAESWSGEVWFDLGGVEILRAAGADKAEDGAVAAWVKSLGDVNKTGDEGSTPLMDKAHDGDARHVKALLEAGADPKFASKRGWTPLMCAACYGSAEVVQLLIDAGSDLKAHDKNCGGQTVIMWAARSGRESKRKVQALLKAGADPTATDQKNGMNALMSAARSGELDTVELLLATGMDLTARTKEGETVLMLAVDHPDILRLLIKAGSGANARDKKGRTALLHAAERSGPVESIQVLLDAGADPGAKDDQGRTALDLARGSNNAGAKARAEVLEKAMKKRPEK